MSEILTALQKMHVEESHLIRNSRITIQVQPFSTRSRYNLQPFSKKTEREAAITGGVIRSNLDQIIDAIKEVSLLPTCKDEHTITWFDFDENGQLQKMSHEFIAGFKSRHQYRNSTNRILKQIVPNRNGMVEVKIGPLGRMADPNSTDFAGSIKLVDFRRATESEEDQLNIQMNSYVLTTHLLTKIKHGARYHIYVSDEGSLDNPIELPFQRSFQN
ncbi:hypothetical protein POF51_25845 [Brevibacillus sp. AG]|uniref:hypothetical protein n=1 Tax=Brevibacillus sp. AG TaxID=3020891 RepID=UPI00232BB28A|nr:hypothetical protein [Brevibacillus sp. AG]MDC0764146.1 hypothetical protein [Brevibacillus sp. AG]